MSARFLCVFPSLFFLVILLSVISDCSHKECEAKVLAKVTSPSGMWTALVEEHICDGFSAADSSTGLSVSLIPGAIEEKKGLVQRQVFSMDMGSGNPMVAATWIRDNELQIKMPSGAYSVEWMTRYGDVDVLILNR